MPGSYESVTGKGGRGPICACSGVFFFPLYPQGGVQRHDGTKREGSWVEVTEQALANRLFLFRLTVG